jgi:hypothetical protein
MCVAQTEMSLRASISEARVRVKSCESEVAKRVQLLTVKLDALEEARRSADAALRSHAAVERELAAEHAQLTTLQTDIAGVLAELSKRISGLSPIQPPPQL